MTAFLASTFDPVDMSLGAGRAAWPGVELSDQAFRGWLRQADIAAAELRAHGADLFLASACAAGDEVAYEHLDRAFLSQLNSRQVGVDLPAEAMAELRQKLRLDLIGSLQPKIAQYQGHGPLRAWVRVCATRVALKLRKRLNQQHRTEREMVEALVAGDAGPELLLTKAEYQDELTAALLQAFAALSPRDKTLLRMNYLDGLNIQEIGLVFGVHRATVARWLVAIRQQVVDQVRTKVAAELRTSSSEFRSVVRLLRPDIHLSLRRILGPDVTAP